jgi:hypothetical protein
MGRHQRPPCPSRALAALLSLALLSGCANTAWSTSWSGPPSTPATGGGSMRVSIESVAVLLGIGLLTGTAYGPFYGPPPMDPERRVMEHDCSKPIEDPSANLRCR